METALLEELLRSSSFQTWSPGPKPVTQPTISVGRGHSFSYKGKTYKNLIVDERHYAPADLAKVWGVDVETIRNLFREEPGVVRSAKRIRGASGCISRCVFPRVWPCVFTRGYPNK
jgi:hypothetical protein